MIKIFLIESQKIVREGLKVLLEEEADFQVFASEDKDVKISQINQFKPNILLISLDNLDDADFDYINIFNRPNGNSNQLNNYQNIKLIIFASKVDKFILNKALQLNCKGYLLKDSSIEELKQAIRSVYNGYSHIGNSVFSQIEQFSPVDQYPVKFSEDNLIYPQEELNTGLITTNNSQLNSESIKLTNQEEVIPEIQESLIIKPNENKSDRFNGNHQKYFESKQQNRLRSIGSSLLLMTVGCVAGIVGVFSVRDRANESFKPIVQYGIVQGELMPIKTDYLGRISQLYFEVGDLVEVDEIVAQLESQSYRQQEQIIADFTQQIERIQQQIDNQKRLLAVNRSHLNKDRQKLEQLLARKLEFKPTIQPQPEKSTKSKAEAESTLKDVQEEVQVALANYQKMEKLMEQQVVSSQEVSRAKQILTIAQNKLIKIQNNHNKNLVKFSQKEAKVKTDERQNIEYIEHLQENIGLWQTQVSEKENNVALLMQELADIQNRLTKVQKDYEQQQLINIKAPTRGIVFHINKDNNELLNEEQTLMELLNCNNLWVEVIVDVNNLKKINLLQSAMVNLNDAQQSFSGAITSIHPLQTLGKEYSQDASTQSSKFSYDASENFLDNQSLFKIKIDFSIPDDYAEQYSFCALQETAIVTFNN